MYLVDTNVISVGARGNQAAPALAAWMDGNTASLFISVVTVAEIEDGITKLRREGATRKANDLSSWLEAVLHLYAKRILTFDLPTARLAGALSDRVRGLGHAPGFADIIIGATAQLHGLEILTRNLQHFAPFGIAVIDPFQGLPGT